jgi:glycosyltransferase involved in cell wall biosynthesis
MLTGVVLARNEAANIVECLTALKSHVEELILIDMESSDSTIELARPVVDQVLTHPLVANFDAARNDAIDAAKHDWLWFVDADERISPRVGQVVRQLVAEQGEHFEAILIPFKSYFCGQWMRYCGWWPGYTMPRVLKRGHFRFSERLHGGVELQGRQIRLPPDPDLGIEHYSYRNVEHYLDKLNRYTSTEAAQLAAQGAQWDWREALREMVRDLWMYYEYNPGQLDGERGWILSWLSGQYRWLARAKLIDLTGDPERPPPFGGTAPSSLDEVLDLWKRELSALRARTPKLPLGIVWRSPLFDPSGYADEGRAFAKGLAGGERPVRAEEIRWSDKPCVLNETDAALLKALTRSDCPPHVVTITDCIPTLVEPDPSAALNILRTTFETDRLPDGWLERLEQFDEVWVIAQQNYRAFRRSGVAPERLRVVPSCYDEALYRPDGPRLELPPELGGKFVFLSVFDWQLRKGWDVLLRAYCQEFAVTEKVGLLLKITRAHGHTLPLIRGQVDKVLVEFGQALIHRPDIVLWDESLTAAEMAALYRSAAAFVLPSRGEGWGRPYMEAMACGLPTIGTRYLGSADFMTDENSLLVDASLVPVPEEAAAEIPPYRGHQWYEPDLMGLRQAMRQVFASFKERQARAERAAAEMRERFGLKSGRAAIETALAAAEQKLQATQLPRPTVGQMHVTLEGEFFAAHSFANINEQLALELAQDERITLSLSRVRNQPTFDEQVPHAWQLRPYFGRDIGPAQVTIRHAFPPSWELVKQGRWVHIQPWEFGHLPIDWIEPLQSRVDECWVPSNYVKRVFTNSGIPEGKVHVIPWGIDPAVFNQEAEPLLLPTERSFRFLFVGGLIGRKGFDTLLEAYLAEFTPADDVCLVVKDLGSQTFYRFGNFREQLLAALGDSTKPSIVYLQQPMTAGQLASLYTACHCLAAPYRAEGFGLPILEAMACGLAPIVSQGGAADDFTSPETAYLVPSREVETTHDWQLAGPPLEFSVSIADVRRAMRLAYEDRERTRRLGEAASQVAHEQFTWKRTAALMADRIMELTASLPQAPGDLPPPKPLAVTGKRPVLAACLAACGANGELGRALAQVTPFVDETIVVVAEGQDRPAAIAREYGAKVVTAHESNGRGSHELAEAAVSAQWVFSLDLDDYLADGEVERLRPLVLRQPPQVTEILVDLPRSRLAAGNGHIGSKLQVRRCLSSSVPTGGG